MHERTRTNLKFEGGREVEVRSILDAPKFFACGRLVDARGRVVCGLRWRRLLVCSYIAPEIRGVVKRGVAVGVTA